MQLADDHTLDCAPPPPAKGDGRVYTIWLQAMDAAENVSELFPVKVAVPHDQRRTAR